MKPRACSCGMISAGELIYNQPRSAVQTGSPSQQTYRKRARFLTGSGRGPAKIFGGLRARNFMKPPFKNPTSATDNVPYIASQPPQSLVGCRDSPQI